MSAWLMILLMAVLVASHFAWVIFVARRNTNGFAVVAVDAIIAAMAWAVVIVSRAVR